VNDGELRPAAATGIRVRDRVRWSDIDMMGVMYFGRYVRFAEMAEAEFFRAIGYSYDELHAQYAIWLARIHLDIDFRSPARLDDEVECRAQLIKVGASSMHFNFPVERASDGTRLADIGLVIASLDAVTLKTTRTPAALRDRLRPHVAAHARQEAAGSP
jgi:acyl-CoA thioester hydrolase